MEEYEIIGMESVNFTGKDGALVQGANIYAATQIDPGRGIGRCAQKFFLSKAKLNALPFEPQPGQIVNILYNKYGKPQTLTLISDVEDVVID